MFDYNVKYPIYCLHIIQYKDRLDNINNLKKKFPFFKDITICNFAKTNVNNIIADRFNELHTKYYDRFKNKDIYGNVFSCAYNWLQIIKCAYENGDEYAFFMEDDLDFKNYISNTYVDNLIKSIPNDADVVKICTCNYPVIKNNIVNVNNNVFNKIKLIDKSEQWKVDCNNSFFMLSRKGMKFYIDSQESNFGISDFNINYDTHNLNVYMHKNFKYFIKYKYDSTINNI